MTYHLPAGDGLCVSTHRHEPERPRGALPGGHLCGGCLDNLHRLLHAVPTLADDLERALVPGSRGSGPKVTGNPEKALPYNDRASDVRRDLLDWLGSWTRLIAEERGHALPDDLTPAGQASWHLTHADWLAGQPWVDEYLSNLRERAAAARSALAGQRTKTVPLGLCPDDQRCDVLTRLGVRCTGTLTAVLDLSDELLPAQVACDTCGTSYASRDLPALGHRLTGGHAWLTTAQAAQVLGLSQDRARVRALKEGWRLRDAEGVRPSRWHAEDVEKSRVRTERQREAS